MSKISEFGLCGDFRLDSVSHIDGRWSFDAKCSFSEGYSSYVRLITGQNGKELRLWMRGSMMFTEAPVIDPDFEIPLNASAQVAGFALYQRLLELGFTGCCNQQNEVVARRPDELRLEQFSRHGIIGRYKP